MSVVVGMNLKVLNEIPQFVDRWQELINEHYKQQLQSLWNAGKVEKLRADMGRKYAKIVTVKDGGSTSVMGFIDLSNGDILKAADWYGPATHVRGNIFDEHGGMKAVTVNGVVYLR